MNINDLLKLTGSSCLLQGLCGCSKGWFFSKWHEFYKRPILVVTKGPHELEAWVEDLRTFGSKDVGIFQELDWAILENPPKVLVTTIDAVKQKVIPPDRLSKIRFEFKEARDLLLKWLVDNGYDRTDCVEYKGEFSHRGGIVDIFPPNSDWPVRVEFAGDSVESIRAFHPQTQCSLKEGRVPKYIYPIKYSAARLRSILQRSSTAKHVLREELDALSSSEQAPRRNTSRAVIKEPAGQGGLEDYLAKDTVVVLDECNYETNKSPHLPAEYWTSREGFEKSLHPRGKTAGFSGRWGDKQVIQLSELPSTINIQSLYLTKDTVFSELSRWLGEGYRIDVWCNNDGEKKRLEEWLQEKKLSGLNIGIGRISKGFVYPEEKLVVISDEEIFCRYKVRLSRRKFKGYGVPIREFTELQPGDYVVHLDHGIGRYLGIQKEMLIIQYAKKAKLYVPMKDAYLVERYMGLGARPPKLNQLGGKRWLSTKIKVERALVDIAGELLEMQAKRKTLKGIAFPADILWQREMEDSFIYEETPDQLATINEVKQDMESSYPMDRLICGDVGYGKTEVAIRAAFKAVMAGKQVAVLVPTTILAQQHYRTFSDRLADYPVVVEMLSRFRSDAEQRNVIKGLGEGKVDIVIGTHRLIQPDVRFKDLGMVVIDEEQRFGVLHKERLKKLRELVDVITMTATPIPRTLYMSLTGIRDMSTINTPPQDRLSVQTIISEYNEQLIREAIHRELNREGQVYFLHNRVETIDKVASRLEKLVPEARFLVGHGQMDEELLALEMDDFVQGKADVLVCTTIIQSGLDIPNVNTIIIDGADKFGLADLYQLRGRVGRYKYQAYAYLLLSRDRVLTGDAKKRLKAIQDFSHLGAGFKIAMQDLEIRGAGNILGSQQHGQIQAVGFDMYCKLLQRNILKLQGKPVEEVYEVILDLGVEGSIPVEYIPSDRIRIDFYKRIANMEEVEEELIDRFGPLPKEVVQLLDIARIKQCAVKKKIKEIKVYDSRVYILWLDGKRVIEDVPGDKLKWLKGKVCGIIG